MTGAIDPGHVCYGCSKPIGDMQPHIHVGLDEWGATQGLALSGIDLRLALCDECTQDAPEGWQQEAHIVEEVPA